MTGVPVGAGPTMVKFGKILDAQLPVVLVAVILVYTPTGPVTFSCPAALEVTLEVDTGLPTVPEYVNV